MNKWLYSSAGILFLLLGYLSSRKGDFASGGVFTVLGIIFIVSNFGKKKTEG
jgi:hypothetical protein